MFFCTKLGLRIPPVTIDISELGITDKILACEYPVKWRFPDLSELRSGTSLPR